MTTKGKCILKFESLPVKKGFKSLRIVSFVAKSLPVGEPWSPWTILSSHHLEIFPSSKCLFRLRAEIMLSWKYTRYFHCRYVASPASVRVIL